MGGQQILLLLLLLLLLITVWALHFTAILKEKIKKEVHKA